MPPSSASSARASGLHLFHAGASALLLALAFLGFREFYVHGRAYPGRPLAPPIRMLIILHGVAMTAWMLLFLVQPLLIASGRRRAHMALGRAGAVIAAAMVVLGLWLAVAAARINPPDLLVWGLTPKPFLAVPVLTVLIFGGLVTAGILTRRRAAVHRTMMLLATLAAMPAAVSRIDAITRLYQGTAWETAFGPFLGTLVVAGILLLAKWILTRSFDRLFAIGFVALVASSALIMRLATTGAWGRVATLLVGR